MSHFNNNNMIPSHEQFLAYVKGKMSPADKSSFEMAVESDAFLSEALEGYQKNPDWVASISDNVNSKIQSKYSSNEGGGSYKYMYLAAAAILVVVLTVLFVNFSENANAPLVAEQTNTPETKPSEEGNAVVAPTEDKDDETIDEIAIDNKNITYPKIKEENRINEKDPLITDAIKVQEDNYEEEIILNLNKKKTDDQKNEGNENNLGSRRLIVSDFAIALKENPARDGKTKTKIKQGQVVTVDKTKNNKKYKQEDLPSYYGGDDALKEDLKSAIKPVNAQKLDAKYDRVIGFDFEVSASGKVDVKTLSFKGNPYPEMKAQIRNAVMNLPNFKPGKATGQKGRIRYGFMMKY